MQHRTLTKPIDITWLKDHFVSMDNRRLFSNRKHGQNAVNSLYLHLHKFTSALNERQTRRLHCFFCWEGNHNGDEGIFRIEIGPLNWGCGTIFRCGCTDPSFPLLGHCSLPILNNGRNVDKYYEITNSLQGPMQLDVNTGIELLHTASEGLKYMLISGNGEQFIKRLDSCVVGELINGGCWTTDNIVSMSAIFYPRGCMRLVAAADHLDDTTDEFDEGYGILCQDMLDFEDWWEQCDLKNESDSEFSQVLSFGMLL